MGYNLAEEILAPIFRITGSAALVWAALFFVLSRCCTQSSSRQRYLTLLNESEDEDHAYDVKLNSTTVVKDE